MALPDVRQLKLVIESILFVAEGPVDLKTLARLTEANPHDVGQAIDSLAEESKERGVRIQRTGQAVQMASAPETASYVQRYLGVDEHQRLSPVVLATLTVIAYKQPVTRTEVERILKKSCDYSVMMLRLRGLITEVGRAEGPGRPYLLGTTFKFLEHFGLEKPEDLPPLPELTPAGPPPAPEDDDSTDEQDSVPGEPELSGADA